MGSLSNQSNGRQPRSTPFGEKTGVKDDGRQSNAATDDKRNGSVANGGNQPHSVLQRSTPRASTDSKLPNSRTTSRWNDHETTEDVLPGRNLIHPGPDFLNQLDNYKLRLQINAPLLLVSCLSFLTRFWRLDHPRSVVLDELVYGNFAAMYVKRQFFFDKGPVLGKQLIALAAYVAGYDGMDRFEGVGDYYRPTTPLWHMRFVPALCGALTPPFAYQLVKALGYSDLAASVAGLLLVFDTAFLTVSRFILLDSMVVFFSIASVLCAVKLIRLPLLPSLDTGSQTALLRASGSRQIVSNPFRGICSSVWNDRLKWSLLLGMSLSFLVNIKYAGLSVLLFVALLLAFDYCSLLDRRDVSYKFFIRYLFLLVSVVLVMPFAVHTATWMAHVAILDRAGGTNDNVMSVRYQASLEGGLNFLAQNQPFNISYGSELTLRSVQGASDGSGRPCWLHSHGDLWPLRYADDRGSSHQQQVTCYTHKDANNFWIIKHPERNTLHVENPAEFVRDNDIVQLVHGLTGRMLNSHDVAAPVSPDCQEVSCYIDYNISMQAEPNWRVHLLQKFEGDEQWHPLVHQVQLVHETTGHVLSVSGQTLPEEAFQQGEVCVTRQQDLLRSLTALHETHVFLLLTHRSQLQTQGSIWLVEEHRYIEERSIKDDHDRRVEVLKMDILPTEPTKMPFWSKFYECMYKLVMSRKESAEDHLYSSSPFEWLSMTRGVAFWLSSTSSAQIFLIGNVVVWYCAALAVFSALAAVAGGAALLQYTTRGDVHTPPTLERLLLAVRVLAGAYLTTFVPHLITDNSLFVTQYLQSLVFAVALTGVLCEELGLFMWHHERICGRNETRWLSSFGAFLAIWFAVVVWVWWKMVGFSYGFYEFSSRELRDLEWKETWDFIKR